MMTRYETNQNRKNLLNYIKGNMDRDGYLVFKCREYAKEHGIQQQNVVRMVKYFEDQNLIEYESMRRDGYLIHYLDIDEPSKKSSNEVEVKVSELPHRKCPKCGFEAPNHYAKFCWSCGASLLSEKEVLRDEFRLAIGKIYRLSTDSKAVNEIMQTMIKVEKFIFSEEKGD